MAFLAIFYGVGAEKLSWMLGVPYWHADRIIACHKSTYSTYWAWAVAQVELAYENGQISTPFGWTMAVTPDTNYNTLLNFPQQASCAELLRLTSVLCVERGLGPMLCAPHHDALYLLCHKDEAYGVPTMLKSCFDDASEIVLGGIVQLRLETKIVHYPHHYDDDKGEEIYNSVMSFLAGKRSDYVDAV